MLSERVIASIPQIIESGKRSMMFLFRYSSHFRVMIGVGAVLCNFIYVPRFPCFSLELYEKLHRNIYISKKLIDLYIKNVVK